MTDNTEVMSDRTEDTFYRMEYRDYRGKWRPYGGATVTKDYDQAFRQFESLDGSYGYLYRLVCVHRITEEKCQVLGAKAVPEADERASNDI